MVVMVLIIVGTFKISNVLFHPDLVGSRHSMLRGGGYYSYYTSLNKIQKISSS